MNGLTILEAMIGRAGDRPRDQRLDGPAGAPPSDADVETPFGRILAILGGDDASAARIKGKVGSQKVGSKIVIEDAAVPAKGKAEVRLAPDERLEPVGLEASDEAEMTLVGDWDVEPMLDTLAVAIEELPIAAEESQPVFDNADLAGDLAWVDGSEPLAVPEYAAEREPYRASKNAEASSASKILPGLLGETGIVDVPRRPVAGPVTLPARLPLIDAAVETISKPGANREFSQGNAAAAEPAASATAVTLVPAPSGAEVVRAEKSIGPVAPADSVRSAALSDRTEASGGIGRLTTNHPEASEHLPTLGRAEVWVLAEAAPAQPLPTGAHSQVEFVATGQMQTAVPAPGQAGPQNGGRQPSG